MQRVRYINPRFGEVDIRPDSQGPFIFESISGIHAADTALRVTYPAGMDGSMYHGLTVSDREITLTMHIKGVDRADMYRHRERLIKVLSSSYSARGRQGQLWYENDHGRWWIPAVVSQGPIVMGARKGNYQTVQIVFYCPDPDFRMPYPIRARQAYIAGGFKFPLIIPAATEPNPGVMFGSRGYRAVIDITGDRPTPIEITITGPALLPKVTNNRTGEYLAVNQPLLEGDTLTINTERGNKRAYITHPDGSETNAMGWLEAGSVWFQLEPGENELEYVSGDDTTTASSVIEAWPRVSGV